MAKMFFSLLLLLAAPASLADGKGAVPEACRNVAAYRHGAGNLGVKEKHVKNCRLLADSLALAEKEAARLRSQAALLAPAPAAGTEESQEELFSRVAAQARVSGEQKAKLARDAHTLTNSFRNVKKHADKVIRKLEDESFAVLKDAEQFSQPQVKPLFEKARADLIALRDAAERKAGEQDRSFLALRDDAREMWRAALASDERSRRLRTQPAEGGVGGDPDEIHQEPPEDRGVTPQAHEQRSVPSRSRDGISDNTLFALGGAALIAGGTVAGLYFVANSTLDKANALAYERIIQAENAAHGVIRNAEETASRILQLARDSVRGVLTDLEETGKRIAERAKADVQSLIRQLEAELRLAFGNLTKEGVEKLRAELRALFEQEIARAQKSGDTALAEKLRKALDSLDPLVAEELARRAKAGTTATSTGTSTNTGTSTATANSTAP